MIPDNKDHILKTKAKKVEKEEIKVKFQLLDVSFSCDYAYQFIYENRAYSKKYIYITSILTYLTLIMIPLNLTLYVAFVQPPHVTYPYKCYDLTTDSYTNCASRNFCICDVQEYCAIPCYTNGDESMECNKLFIKYSRYNNDNPFASINFGNQLLIKMNNYGNKLNMFDNILSDFCYLKFYMVYFLILITIGTVIGYLIVGMLSSYYGKKKIIFINMLILFISQIISMLYMEINKHENTFNFSQIIYFFVNYFITGLFNMPTYSMIYNLYMECYLNTEKYRRINGILHTSIVFVILLFYIFQIYVKSYKTYSYVHLSFSFIFLIVFHNYFVESPRYYSELKDKKKKKLCLEKMIDKVLIFKEENNKMEKYWNTIKVFDSSTEKVEGDKIIFKTNEESIEKENEKKNDITKFSNVKDRRNNLVEININKKMDKINKSENEIGEREEFSFRNIRSKFMKDKYMKKFGFIIYISWICINISFYTIIMAFLKDLCDPNSRNYNNISVLILTLIMGILMPMIMGKISYYFNTEKIIIYLLLLLTLLCIIEDYQYIWDLDRINYYGVASDNDQTILNNQSKYGKSFILVLLQVVYSLSILNIVTVVPTLYRDIYVGSLNSVSFFSSIVSFVIIYTVDTPLLIIGLLLLSQSILFCSVNIGEIEIRFKEYTDMESSHNLNKMNNKNKII